MYIYSEKIVPSNNQFKHPTRQNDQAILPPVSAARGPIPHPSPKCHYTPVWACSAHGAAAARFEFVKLILVNWHPISTYQQMQFKNAREFVIAKKKRICDSVTLRQ